MKKFLSLCSLLGITTTLQICCPPAVVAEEINDGYIGPAVTFGDGATSFGAAAKMRLGSSFSLRPYIDFPNGRTNYGTSLTYDFGIRQPAPTIAPFVGFGLNVNNGENSKVAGFYQLGIDAGLSEKFTLFGNLSIPTGPQENGRFTVGGSLRF